MPEHIYDHPYCINLIDTPGFGDTSGPEKDCINFELIREIIMNFDSDKSIQNILIQYYTQDNTI